MGDLDNNTEPKMYTLHYGVHISLITRKHSITHEGEETAVEVKVKEKDNIDSDIFFVFEHQTTEKYHWCNNSLLAFLEKEVHDRAVRKTEEVFRDYPFLYDEKTGEDLYSRFQIKEIKVTRANIFYKHNE